MVAAEELAVLGPAFAERRAAEFARPHNQRLV